MSDYDPFKVDTGLPDNVIGTMTQPVFKFDAELQAHEDGSPQCVMEFVLVWQESEMSPYVYKAKTGKGWEPGDGGESVRRIDGDTTKHFHQNSGMGCLVSSSIETEAAELMRDLYTNNGLTPYIAPFWDGWTFRWERKTFKGGGDIPDYDRLLPTELIAAPGGTAPTAPAPAAAVKSAPATKGGGGTIKGIDQATYDALFKLAYDAPNHAGFQEQAYAQYGDRAEVHAVIDDQTNDSVWEAAVKQWNLDHPSK